ncbi:UDP-3-O-[3-hydroxymyristoyl] N-acetylglucosamine deacetylase [Aliiroseovarius crassostreae]|uniref:UDP-3-O-acyl-N-acetylglucosamine deacetylase n=1 Tax=Aliiroseovarius crassostreae TaxID=154981 RepID=A0A0P7ISX9_9RHOB|nr:UDP-3-O-acyl-N-acetylglucosamine deacetylase [Aliiroseovarius crassostreae]KPN61917.1 UDP-3-O-[3-hydroxymyristoyl] N-acetylglucosamine deacetylase [Aliiroseovarius crassostreae]SFU69954.1 UDP-3-O-[3-hydroxymyristoyl] N-acetylglucosamine deacetylase [Aliiroseovarius crassostreae]
MQTTLTSSVTFSGTGLHSGRPVRMTVRPASAEYGIWFKRVDIHDQDNLIPAHWASVVPSRLCTLIRNDAGTEVSTIEHIMAALAGCGIHNALVEIDGPEVPILDGSSSRFVEGLIRAGVRELNAPVRVIKILSPVEYREGDAWARLAPAEGFEMDFHISFPDAAIGTQDKSLNLSNGNFVRELSDCRTFCRQADVDAMRAAGLALGGTYENAVVVDGDDILSPGGLRRKDEAVRHKMLDALGDLYLAGAPLMGRYIGHKAGHAMTNKLLRALFDQPEAWRLVMLGHEAAKLLPGVGVVKSDLPLTA